MPAASKSSAGNAFSPTYLLVKYVGVDKLIAFRDANEFWLTPLLDFVKKYNTKESSPYIKYIMWASYAATFLVQVLWDVLLFSVGWFFDLDYKYLVDVCLELYRMFIPEFIMSKIDWWYGFAHMDTLDYYAETLNVWIYSWFD